MKKTMLQRRIDMDKAKLKLAVPRQEPEDNAVLEEAMMEVAASPEHPYPAPQFLKRIFKEDKPARSGWLKRAK